MILSLGDKSRHHCVATTYCCTNSVYGIIGSRELRFNSIGIICSTSFYSSTLAIVQRSSNSIAHSTWIIVSIDPQYNRTVWFRATLQPLLSCSFDHQGPGMCKKMPLSPGPTSTEGLHFLSPGIAWARSWYSSRRSASTISSIWSGKFVSQKLMMLSPLQKTGSVGLFPVNTSIRTTPKLYTSPEVDR